MNRNESGYDHDADYDIGESTLSVRENAFAVSWPENRWLHRKDIETYYSDGLANGEIDPELPSENWVEKARALHFSGMFTFLRDPRLD